MFLMREDIKRLRGSIFVDDRSGLAQSEAFEKTLLDNYVHDNVKAWLRAQGRDIDDFDLSWTRDGVNISVTLTPKIEKVEISCNLSVDTTPHPDKRLNVINTQESKMVKVGDRVKLVKAGGAWGSDNLGKEGTVTGFDGGKYVKVLFDNSGGHTFENDWGNISHLEIISTTPTYSIPADTETVTLKYADGSTQDIDVKDRARGVPEWVKDGAWVVNEASGAVMRLEVLKHALRAYDVNGNVKFYGYDLKNAPAIFRPFTNSDWKWGMWAEYRGEKVFVCENSEIGVYASKKTDPYCFITYEEITPTTSP